MLSHAELKQLAELTIQDGKVNSRAAEFVLEKLSKGELKEYLKFLKSLLNKQRVYVTISDVPSQEYKKKVEELFKGKTIIFEEDKSFGAGMKIQADDMIFDFSLKSAIEKAANSLKG